MTTRLPVRLALAALIALATHATPAMSDEPARQPAQVHRATVDVHAAPDISSARLETLQRGTVVQITGQDGLWYRLALEGGTTGFVRLNDVRMLRPAAEAAPAQRAALFPGSAGRGRVSETATVRGINAGQLRAGGSNPEAVHEIEGFRVDDNSAIAYARAQGWQARDVPWPEEARQGDAGGIQATQAERRSGLAAARGLLSRLGGGVVGETVVRVADRGAGKSEAELVEEELALGPVLAGRVLAVAPPWNNADAQRRVNLVGRWLALQTSRPELPWTFAVIDDGEANAFAAPGGYVLVTRGLYELLADDTELAAVLAHELSHVVQRDHYEVIRKQQLTRVGQEIAMEQLRTPAAATLARDYVDRHGAAVLLSSLDRSAEYRADQAAGIYLARAGLEPLAFYGVLQKLSALGSRPARLSQLYETHPPLEERLDRLDRSHGAPAPAARRGARR